MSDARITEVRVVRATQVSEATAQTAGMMRRAGIDGSTVGASRIWMGPVTAPPGTSSGRHHHGEAETAAYVLSGRIRIYYGDGFQQYQEAGPGDFLFVPPHLPHLEMNVSDEPAQLIVARSPDNIVVGLD